MFKPNLYFFFFFPITLLSRSFDLAAECDFYPEDTNYFHRKITREKKLQRKFKWGVSFMEGTF